MPTPQTPYSDDVDWISITDSNLTEDDLPGPGRNLGNVYSALGMRLEGVLSLIARRHAPGRQASAIGERSVATSGGSNDGDWISIISSNMTEDNLPGPGRILGNVYASLGRRSVDILNSLANLAGLGPQAVELRVRKRDEFVTNFALLEERRRYAKKEIGRQREDIKKLVRYARSKTESTRNQALDAIISLAGKSDFFLKLLREVNAAEVIKGEEINVWKFYDTSVQINSRMALTCVQDGKLFQLLKEYKAPANTGTSLTAFIRENPEDSFLALRLFTRLMSYWAIWNMEEALRELNELLESPERIPYIDWDEVDKIFEYWLTKIMNMGPDSPPISRRTSMLLLRMCQSKNCLPRTFQSHAFRQWISAFSSPSSSLQHLILGSLLSTASTEGRSIDLAPSVMPFFNPADAALGAMARVWGSEWEPSFPLHATEISCKCEELVRVVNSGNQYLKQRALACIGVVLDHDFYSRTLMMEAASSTPLVNLPDYEEMIRTTGRKRDHDTCLGGLWSNQDRSWGFGRHCDRDGNLAHGVPHIMSESRHPEACTDSCILQVVLLDLMDIIWIEFVGETPVRIPNMIIPILAGRRAGGQIAFLAMATLPERNIGYCAITEGMTPKGFAIIDDDGSTVVPTSIQLFALRHPPDTYPNLSLIKCGFDGASISRGYFNGFAAEITEIVEEHPVVET